MRKISVEELNEKLERRKSGERLNLREVALSGADLSGYNLDEIDFSMSQFHRVCFDGASLKKEQFGKYIV